MTRALLLDRFRWVDGHADLWPVFRDGAAFAEVVKALAEPFRDAGVTAVCGIESRGFLLGGAVALELGVGFAAVRKAAGLFPGEKLTRETDPDYRGFRHVLRMQRSALRCLIAATSSRRRNRPGFFPPDPLGLGAERIAQSRNRGDFSVRSSEGRGAGQGRTAGGVTTAGTAVPAAGRSFPCCRGGSAPVRRRASC